MYEDLLRFWFDECAPAQWWGVDPAFDQAVRARFAAVHQQAVAGELYGWRSDPRGRLAEVIVLDQFSRNLHRGSPAAFAADPMALALAQEAVAAGLDAGLPVVQRNFLYMPYMHSESRQIHDVAQSLFAATGNAATLAFEMKHKAIIERFGRYPHRNAILGRASTAEELVFLSTPGSSF